MEQIAAQPPTGTTRRAHGDTHRPRLTGRLSAPGG